MDHREVVCDTYIWTEIDLDWFPRDVYVNRQVRAFFRWHVSIQYYSENFKNLIKKKNPVYGSQGGCMWYIHMNRNWFGLISKGWLC